MRVANSPDIIQQKINYLFHGFEFIREYIDKKISLKRIQEISYTGFGNNYKLNEEKRT